ARFVTQRPEDEAGAVGAGVGVPLPVLGVADRARLLVGGADERSHAVIAPDGVEGRTLELRLLRRLGLGLDAVDLRAAVGRVLGLFVAPGRGAEAASVMAATLAPSARRLRRSRGLVSALQPLRDGL